MVSCPLPTAKEMAQLDSAVMRHRSISSLDLMEQVGRELTRQIRILYRSVELQNRKTLILVGPGNNGGDGLVIARELHRSRQVPVTVVLAHSKKLSPDCLVNLKRFQSIGGSVFSYGKTVLKEVPIISIEEFRFLLNLSGVVIDALLGSGQLGEPRDGIREILTAVRGSEKPLFLSIDIPTGVSGDTGDVFPGAFAPDITLTIQHTKVGMTQGRARMQCGHIIEIEGGIQLPDWTPEFSVGSEAPRAKLPTRTANVHKGSFGHLLVLGGSHAMPGAPVLCSRGAFGAGVGKVTQLSFQTSEGIPPEVMQIPTHESVIGRWHLDAFRKELRLKPYTGVVFGPGIGVSDDTKDAFLDILNLFAKNNCPYVLDADGLNILADGKKLVGQAIMTPHPGEAARLLQCTTEEIQRNRPQAVQELHSRYGAVVLLKGAGTILWDGSSGRVNPTGTPYLATAGSGDLLSGVIGGLLAQGLSPFEAGELGCYLHGMAAERIGMRPFLASALAKQVSLLMSS